jgi:uncharacterized membrane protein YidH (DUF202 family)
MCLNQHYTRVSAFLTQTFDGILEAQSRFNERKEIVVIIMVIVIIIIINNLKVFHHYDTLHLHHHQFSKEMTVRILYLVSVGLVALGWRLVLHFPSVQAKFWVA